MVNYHYVDRMLHAPNKESYNFDDQTIKYLSSVCEAYHQCIIDIEADNSLDNQIKYYNEFFEKIYDDNGKLYRDTRQVIENLKRRKNIINAEEMDYSQQVLREDIFRVEKYIK